MTRASRFAALMAALCYLSPFAPLAAEPPPADIPEAQAPERPTRPSRAPT